eukprot:symbB.v1.2.017790.t1/scaffold1394.1/size200789/13
MHRRVTLVSPQVVRPPVERRSEINALKIVGGKRGLPARPAAPEFSRIGVEKLRKPGSAQPEQIAGRKPGKESFAHIVGPGLFHR